MDWMVLLWAVIVCVIYVGGYLFPATLGVFTSKMAAVYALFLTAAVVSFALRALKSPSSSGTDQSRM